MTDVHDIALEQTARIAELTAEVARLTRERDEARESLRLLRNEALAGLDAGQLRRLREANERARKAERERDSIRDEAARDLREYRDAANRAAAEHDASLAHALAASSAATEQAIALGRRVDDLVADRNTLAAALAEVREAALPVNPACGECRGHGSINHIEADVHMRCGSCRRWHETRMRSALAAAPADLATARDARVRAEALRESADTLRRARAGISWRDGGAAADSLLARIESGFRAEAERIGGGR